MITKLMNIKCRKCGQESSGNTVNICVQLCSTCYLKMFGTTATMDTYNFLKVQEVCKET